METWYKSITYSFEGSSKMSEVFDWRSAIPEFEDKLRKEFYAYSLQLLMESR